MAAPLPENIRHNLTKVVFAQIDANTKRGVSPFFQLEQEGEFKFELLFFYYHYNYYHFSIDHFSTRTEKNLRIFGSFILDITSLFILTTRIALIVGTRGLLENRYSIEGRSSIKPSVNRIGYHEEGRSNLLDLLLRLIN